MSRTRISIQLLLEVDLPDERDAVLFRASDALVRVCTNRPEIAERLAEAVAGASETRPASFYMGIKKLSQKKVKS